MSHLLSDHPDWPNAMTTPTPRSNREWRELAEQAQRELSAAQERVEDLEVRCANAEARAENWHKVADSRSAELIKQMARAEASEKAAAFAGKVLAESREYLADLDGAWLQDTATECGLLECVILPGSCGEDCRCDESSVSNEPRECYRFTDAGRAAIAEGKK